MLRTRVKDGQAEMSPVPLVIRAGPELTLAAFWQGRLGRVRPHLQTTVPNSQGQAGPISGLCPCPWLDRACAPPILLGKHQGSWDSQPRWLFLQGKTGCTSGPPRAPKLCQFP